MNNDIEVDITMPDETIEIDWSTNNVIVKSN